MKPAEDDELEEEAEWIYRNAFSTPTISMQVEPKYSYNNKKMYFSCSMQIVMLACVLGKHRLSGSWNDY